MAFMPQNNYFCSKCKYVMFNFQNFLERSAFGVSAYIGDKIGVASSRVRLYFIYLSCATFGSPIIIYLFFAFWLNVKKYIQERRVLSD